MPADVYAIDFHYAYGGPSSEQRLDPHSFTLVLEFAGTVPGSSNTAIFRSKDWLQGAHANVFGPRPSAAEGNKAQEAPSRAIPPRTHGRIV